MKKIIYYINILFLFFLCLIGCSNLKSDINNNSNTSIDLNKIINELEFNDKTIMYDGEEHNIFIEGDIPQGLAVSYVNNGKVDVGEYIVTAILFDVTGKYQTLPSLEAKLTIIKADLDISFESQTFSYDGLEHSIYINETLPEGVLVEYSNNNKVDAGTYLVTAFFHDTTGNYNVPSHITSEMNIVKDGAFHEVFFHSYNNKESIVVKNGDTIKNIPNPALKVGYNGIWQFDFETRIYQDTDIYCLYEAKEFTIYLNPNGGIVYPNKIVIEYGEKINLPLPEKKGEIFIGWYYNDEIFDDELYLIDDDCELIAKWEPIPEGTVLHQVQVLLPNGEKAGEGLQVQWCDDRNCFAANTDANGVAFLYLKPTGYDIHVYNYDDEKYACELGLKSNEDNTSIEVKLHDILNYNSGTGTKNDPYVVNEGVYNITLSDIDTEAKVASEVFVGFVPNRPGKYVIESWTENTDSINTNVGYYGNNPHYVPETAINGMTDDDSGDTDNFRLEFEVDLNDENFYIFGISATNIRREKSFPIIIKYIQN